MKRLKACRWRYPQLAGQIPVAAPDPRWTTIFPIKHAARPGPGTF
jgi:hypothetical protein